MRKEVEAIAGKFRYCALDRTAARTFVDALRVLHQAAAPVEVSGGHRRAWKIAIDSG